MNGILHPDLWLWDAWTLKIGHTLNLYCLALARTDDLGQATSASVRNDYRFHIRHFASLDNGASWSDFGALAWPGMLADGSDGRNIWSGSVLQLRDGRTIHGFTGIRARDNEHPFVQSASIRTFDGDGRAQGGTGVAFTCSERDYEKILQAGYFLGPKAALGHKDGEDGGPILCWRDPFLFEDLDGALYAFLAAKRGPLESAIAQIAIEEKDGEFVQKEILPPIELPDRGEFTQAEVPKIYFDTVQQQYFLLISSTDRLRESQPDSEVTKEHRLYVSDSLRGPWKPFSDAGSRLIGLDGLFGASIIDADFRSGDITFIGPYSEMVDATKQLSFAPPITLNIFEGSTSQSTISA